MKRLTFVLAGCMWLPILAQAQSPVVPPGAGTAQSPYLISQLGHLVWMGDTVGSSSGKYYSLQADLDAAATAGWHGGAGFRPIGTNSGTAFRGFFDGQGHAIQNLHIQRPTQDYQGLFGYARSPAVIRNTSLVGGTVSGGSYIGALVGVNGSLVSNCYATTAVAGSTNVGEFGAGGLVGFTINGGSVRDSHAAGTVCGYHDVGGLVGANNGGSSYGCRATGPVTGENSVGGLAGGHYGNDSVISNCMAQGAVQGTGSVGGLIGDSNGTIMDSWASGSVTGSYQIGGLVGDLFNGSNKAMRCYATGAVAGDTSTGGLVGMLMFGTVIECYAVGGITAGWGTDIGGLIGRNESGTVSNSYWDINTTGMATSAGGTGRTTAQMKQQATYVGWNFPGFWRIVENVTYPELFLTPILGVSPVSRSMNYSAGTTTFAVSNAGAGTLSYVASESESWLSLAGGASGINSGTITVACLANLGASARTGTVRITAAGAYGSPTNVTVVQAPVALTPSGGQVLTSRRPMMSWTPMGGATWIHLWVVRNGQTFLDQWIQGANNWTPPADWPSGNYRWWLQPWSPSQGLGSWSWGADFSIAALTPGALTQIEPAGVQTNHVLNYRWQKDANATWYHLWAGRIGAGPWHDRWFELSGTGMATVVALGLGPHPGPAKPIQAAPLKSIATNRPTFHWGGGACEWWLRGWGPDGYGPWSGPMAFSIPHAAGTWYRVYVNRGSTLAIDQWTNGANLPSPVTLSSGAHSWWLGVWDAARSQIIWSDRADFTVP